MNTTHDKPKVGQILLRERLHRNSPSALEPTAVTKVGRKYFSTSCGREYQLDSWRQRHFDATRVWPSRQAFDDHKERLRLDSLIRQRFNGFGTLKPLSLDKLRAMLAIIDSP